MHSKSPCQRVKYLPSILNHLKALNHSNGMNVPSTHMESIAQLTKSIRRASKPKLEKKKNQERQINAPEIYE